MVGNIILVMLIVLLFIVLAMEYEKVVTYEGSLIGFALKLILLLSLILFVLNLQGKSNINELTVFSDGRLEVKGTGILSFSQDVDEKLNFNEYKVKSGKKNTYSKFNFGEDNVITLTSEYYEQYENMLKNEKTAIFKIKK